MRKQPGDPMSPAKIARCETVLWTSVFGRRRKWRAAFIGAALLSSALLAQSGSPIKVSGSFSGSTDPGASVQGSFTCSGTPTCSGTYQLAQKKPECSNIVFRANSILVAGLDLAAPGSVQGSFKMTNAGGGVTRNPDGTCFVMGPVHDVTGSYSGTWSGTTGVLVFAVVDDVTGGTIRLDGTFTADISAPPPVFQMVVSASIDANIANASAAIQFRPQDVGSTGSVFVFALAPRSLAKEAMADYSKDAPAPCVLAQLNASGQLTSTSASSLQPYVSGVLSSQGQAVTILNNVPTPQVAGATFFVGYGPDASTMLNTGVNRNAVSVPGTQQCPDSIAAAPGALSGLWWNPNESGWGISFTQRRNIVFAAWYTYDASGNPKWYVASNCGMPAGTTGTSGTCSGSLYEASGPTFFGTPFNPSLVHPLVAGSLRVNFQDANNASMTYTVAGQTRTVAITRQIFQNGPTAPAVDYTDLWWNPSESGWGMAVTHQFGVMFLTWFVYDNSGKPMWYAATRCTVSGAGCSGTLYRATGPAFGPTFDPSMIQAFSAGTVSASFTDANNGTLSYTVNGVTSSKIIARQLF